MQMIMLVFCLTVAFVMMWTLFTVPDFEKHKNIYFTLRRFMLIFFAAVFVYLIVTGQTFLTGDRL